MVVEQDETQDLLAYSFRTSNYQEFQICTI
jgi:hypothetical protein